MGRIKHIINSLIYRITGKVLRKTIGNLNWKTINTINDKSSRNIFGYRLDDPSRFDKKWWENPIFHQKQNNANKTRPLLIVGQGWTGSSAVVNYLCEFRGILQYGSEFRISRRRPGE